MRIEHDFLSSTPTDPIEMRVEIFQAIKGQGGGSSLGGPFAHLALVHPTLGYDTKPDVTGRSNYVVSYEFMDDARRALEEIKQNGGINWSIEPIHSISGWGMTKHFASDGITGEHEHPPNYDRPPDYTDEVAMGIEAEYKMIDESHLLSPGENL